MNKKPKRRVFATSWQLFKSCVDFLKANKDLMALPIISLLSSLVMMVLLLGGGIFELSMAKHYDSHFAVGIVLLGIAYFALSFLTIFFNATLIVCAATRLKGEAMTLRQAFGTTSKRIPSLIGWCLVSSVIGLLINALERSHNILETIVAFVIGFSRALCSYFVLPIMVLENMGPIAALKHSVRKFRRNWRRVGSVQMIFLLFFMAVIAGVAAASQLIGYFPVIPVPVIIGVCVLAYLAFMAFSVTLGAVANSAIYLHTLKEVTVPYFDASLLDSVIVRRKGQTVR